MKQNTYSENWEHTRVSTGIVLVPQVVSSVGAIQLIGNDKCYDLKITKNTFSKSVHERVEARAKKRKKKKKTPTIVRRN